MNHTRREISPGLILDARRAVYLAEQRVLAVADLHFGYAWTHRARGQIFPVPPMDETSNRLLALIDDYQPETLAVLGDIVHGVVPVKEWRDALRDMIASLQQRANVVLIGGNHDRHLSTVIETPLLAEWSTGPHRLLHGDTTGETLITSHLEAARTAGGRVICGHEHPAIVVGDRVAHSARVPCFLASDGLLVLPAFSEWAAGSNIRRGEYLSPYLRATVPHQAVAILAGKLLPMRLG